MIKLAMLLLLMSLFVSCNDPAGKSSIAKNDLQFIISPTETASAEPYLFTDKNGVVYLSWIEKRKDSSYLKFSQLKNNEWSKSEVIASGNNWFVNWADYPMLASDGTGNMLAHFLEKSEKGKYTYDVKLISSNDGGKLWDSIKILHDDGKKAEHGFVSMLPYNENYFISWLDGRNTAMEDTSHLHANAGAMTLRAAVVNKQGRKINEWELDNRVCDCCQTSVAITTNGPIVVYRDRSESEIRDISIVRQVNGQWTTPKPVYSDNWKIEGCPVNGPRADARHNDLAITWFTSANKTGHVYVIFSNDGGATFASPVRMDEENAIGRVDIVMLDDGSAIVSWMEGSTIKASRVYKNGKKDPSIVIATSTESRSGGFPQMTMAEGGVVFAWTDDKEKTIKIVGLPL